MIIRKIQKNPESFGFNVFIDYYADVDTEDEAVAEWVSYAFVDGFVLLQLASKIYAGGCTDNAKGWEEGWNSDEAHQITGEYQLKCSSRDATAFLLKFEKGQK